VETWEFHNFTEDAPPLHIHLVQFEIIERVDANGIARPPEPWETGPKDTMISYPGEIIRVKAQFDRTGQYVWHCHILEHEDNEMMRPYAVGPVQDPRSSGGAHQHLNSEAKSSDHGAEDVDYIGTLEASNEEER
jgi:hypothetical protein